MSRYIAGVASGETGLVAAQAQQLKNRKYAELPATSSYVIFGLRGAGNQISQFICTFPHHAYVSALHIGQKGSH